MDVITKEIPEGFGRIIGEALFEALKEEKQNEEDYRKRCADLMRRYRRRDDQRRRRRDARFARLYGNGGSRRSR